MASREFHTPALRMAINKTGFDTEIDNLRNVMDNIYSEALETKKTLSQEQWYSCFDKINDLLNAYPVSHCEGLYDFVREYLIQKVSFEKGLVASQIGQMGLMNSADQENEMSDTDPSDVQGSSKITFSNNSSNACSSSPALAIYYNSWCRYLISISIFDKMFHSLNNQYTQADRQSEESYDFMTKKPVIDDECNETMNDSDNWSRPVVSTINILNVERDSQEELISTTENANSQQTEQPKQRHFGQVKTVDCSGKYEIKELGLRIWRNIMEDILKPKIISLLLDIIHHQRSNNFNEIRKLLFTSSELEKMENFSDQDSLLQCSQQNDEACEELTCKKVFKIVESILNQNMDCVKFPESFRFYQAIFERPYWFETKDFYGEFSVSLMSENDPCKYVKEALSMIQSEKVRSEEYLHVNSRKKINDTMIKLLVKDQKAFILSDIKDVINKKKWQELQNKYILLKTIPDGLRDLCKEYQNYAEEKGLRIIKPFLIVNNHPEKFINAILDWYKDTYDHISTWFLEDASITDIMKTRIDNENNIAPPNKTQNGGTSKTSKDFKRALDNAMKNIVNFSESYTKHPNAPLILAKYCDIILRHKGEMMGKDDSLDDFKARLLLFVILLLTEMITILTLDIHMPGLWNPVSGRFLEHF